MTAEQERALLEATAADLDDDLRAALAKIIKAIQDGEEPRAAVAAAMDSFRGHMAEVMATALSAMLAQAIGSEAAMSIEVGVITLSSRLYAEALAAGEAVQGVVQRHVKGFQDARKLALDLFEGYGFRDPKAELLKIAPGNPALPKYLREALAGDAATASALQKAFAQLQVDKLSTPALQAAYKQVLAAINQIEGKAGQALLEKRLKVAFFERMRYFAQRIAQTELHRAYAEREALLILSDEDVEFVQIRRAPGQHKPCICALIVGRDLYKLGAGVYPKAKAPVPPFHPFCLPGSAKVSTGGWIAAVTKRWYQGDMVIVATASGKRLEATINHPVLTSRGWVAAGLLDVGGDVISRVGPEWVETGDVHDENVPTSIAEVFDSFGLTRDVATVEVPTAAPHFHGDGMAGQVAVVRADRKLWCGDDAALLQRLKHGALVSGFKTAALLGQAGLVEFPFQTAPDAPQRVVRGNGEGASLFGSEPLHPDHLLLGRAAGGDASPHDSDLESASADAEMALKILEGSTGQILLDEVISVHRYAASCHVYNLETTTHHYTADGIVTHNCRCVMAPRLDLTGRKAAPRDEGGDAYFLNKLGEPMAGRIMGSQAKRDLVRSGIPAEQVTNESRLPMYKIKRAEQVD